MKEAVTFRDLIAHDLKLPPAESQLLAAKELADRVRRSALTWWPDNTDTNRNGRQLLVGVVVWSNYDLRLLDLMNEAVARGMVPTLRAAVFDLDDLVSPADIQHPLLTTGTYEPPPICDWAPGPLTDAATRFVAKLERILPGIGDVFQPPAVGYWEAGQLKETASGFSARQLVGRLLGFDPQLVLEQAAQATG